MRDYSDGTPAPEQCAELTRVLSALSAQRMVVGHTVQQQGINSACEGKVWRIDVGLSRFYGNKPSVLEIRGDQVRALTEPPRRQPLVLSGLRTAREGRAAPAARGWRLSFGARSDGGAGPPALKPVESRRPFGRLS